MNHKHEWRILHIQWPCSTSVFCNCGEKLELDEIERHLNATNALVAYVRHWHKWGNQDWELYQALPEWVREMLDD